MAKTPEDKMTQPAKPRIHMSTDFKWQRLNQVRLHVSVAAVIDLITKTPRPIKFMDISEWSLRESNGATAVQHVTGIHCAYHQHKLPPTLRNTFPVLVGTGNGKRFLIDGAHRMAKALIDGLRKAPAIILTEEDQGLCTERHGGKFREENWPVVRRLYCGDQHSTSVDQSPTV